MRVPTYSVTFFQSLSYSSIAIKRGSVLNFIWWAEILAELNRKLLRSLTFQKALVFFVCPATLGLALLLRGGGLLSLGSSTRYLRICRHLNSNKILVMKLGKI